MNPVYSKLKKILAGAQRVVIASHVDPDCDTLGSALAMVPVIKKLRKGKPLSITMYCASGVAPGNLFLPGAKKYVRKLKGTYDVGLAFDCGNFARISPDGQLRKCATTLINIDHHAGNEMYGDLNIVEKAAATGQVVYRIARALKIPIDRDMAVNLYAAIATDTGNFRYDSTTPEVFDIAADLARHGADTAEIAKLVYERKSRRSLDILGAALQRLKIGAGGRLAWVALPRSVMKKYGATSEDLNGVVETIRSLDGVDVALLMREIDGGQIRINLRSKGPNIRPLAEKWKGGGHAKASGATATGPLSKVHKQLVKDAETFLKK